MRMRCVPLIVVAVAALTVGACSGRAGSDATLGTPPSGATLPSTGGAALSTVRPPGPTTPSNGGAAPSKPALPASEPTERGADYRVSYGWGVPSTRITVNHPITAPIAPPPAAPLPYLVAIYVGDHPQASPKYGRISFYFRGGFPSYNFQYAKQVLDDPRGMRISLEGNSYLGIHFVQAQAHDPAGNSTVRTSPDEHIGFRNLKSYAFGGDFEGYLTYGLGIQVAPNTDQVLTIRAGELKKPDGSGHVYYVVYFDVHNG